MQLKHPVHFVCPDSLLWPELKGWDGSKFVDQILSDRSSSIMDNWVLRTYYHLHLAGAEVTVSARLRPEAVNIASVRDFGRRQRDFTSFVVIPKADAHDPQLANFQILQNGLQPPSDDTATIWHWPQPSLIPRDPVRGELLDSLCYKGLLINLDENFRSGSFLTDLAALGVTFDVDGFDGEHAQHSWNDYSSFDAVLAVRNLTTYDALKKPASKLVNAWFAELPALLGPEPAFREIGTDGEDYIEVKTPRDVLQALAGLRENPDLFRGIVAAGQRRRSQFSESALIKLWIETLNGPVAESFARWQRMPLWKRRVHLVRGMLRESQAKARDKEARQSGARLLDPIQEMTA